METQNYIILAVTAYKVASLLAGVACCFMGFKLFTLGIWGNAGELSTKFNSNKLVLKNAAPGTFFVVLGTVILAVTIWKGLNFDHKLNKGMSTEAESRSEETIKQPALPDELPE